MACMTTEKSPLAQKRCSLPGPVGPLNLYAAHQQRRLSERGLMIYRPNKPDIDLIRDFTTTNQRKNSTPSFSFHQNHSGHFFGGGLQHAHASSGSLSCLSRNSPLAGPSTSSSVSYSLPSTSAHNFRRASFSPSSSSSDPNPGPGVSFSPLTSIVNFDTSYNANTNNGNGSCGNNAKTPGSSSATSTSNISSGSGCRKVRLRIQKNPGTAKEKYVELQQTEDSFGSSSNSNFQRQDSSSGSDDNTSVGNSGGASFMRNPLFDSRRFSDSVACRPPAISISITPDFTNNGNAGIVCSTGDLLTLKCLTSSAQEIRYYNSPYGTDSDAGASSPRILAKENRSKSFDATFTLARKGAGSSWFSRRHLPISVKLPLPMPSPVVPKSPLSTSIQMSTFHQANQQPQTQLQPQMRTPILTVTNENAVQSELIEIPSPPAVTPVSSGGSPGERTTVQWGKNGFVLDAAALGFAIENHLRKVDMKRRATFSTLYEPPPSSMDLKVTARPRSASACVIAVPKELIQGKGGGGRRESISAMPSSSSSVTKSAATSRRSSLKCTPTRFPWEREKANEKPLFSRDRSLSVAGVTMTRDYRSEDKPIDFSGSFVRTTTEFGEACIDEEDDGSGGSGNGSERNLNNKTATTKSATKIENTNTKTFSSPNIFRKSIPKISSRTPSLGSLPGRRRASSAATDGASLPLLKKGASEDAATSSSSSAKKSGGDSSGNGMSICGAIRDFIMHSMRS